MDNNDIEFMTRTELKEEVRRLREPNRLTLSERVQRLCEPENQSLKTADVAMITIIVAELAAVVYLLFWT